MAQTAAGGSDVRIGIDIGGTFTDLVLSRGDRTLFVNKTSSTPADPGDAVITGLVEMLDRLSIDPHQVQEIVHGTTVGSNAILQRKGARTALLTTKGFRDVLEIGRIRTPDMFNLAWEKPEPLAPRRHRREIDERMAADGSVVVPIDTAEVVAVGRDLLDEGIEAVAICFLNSYVNPEHEIAAATALRTAFPDLRVTASHEVLPEIKEYERTSTTVVNAYLLPEMQTYIDRLRGRIAELGIRAPLQVVASNGGMMGAPVAARLPVFAVASGPAGGVTGAASLAADFDYGDLIIFDMGGTTAKASIGENGQAALVTEYEFRDGISSPSRFIKGGGYMLKVPAVDIAEVGAGGGSLAAIDAGGLLTVGPASAGADPGPACYGRGNDRPTVTDANMCLGYLNPEALAGGSLRVHRDKAGDAIQRHIAEPLGLSIEEAAQGVRQIANVSMARAIRSVTVERGRDPRDMTIIAFGGGGPLHAVDVARILGVKRVIAPVMSGVFSAVGMLTADVEHNFVRAAREKVADVDSAWLAARLGDLEAEGRAMLAEEGYTDEGVELRFAADLRYVGQSSELTIPFDPETVLAGGFTSLAVRFYEDYHATYGYATDEAVELAALRLTAVGRAERLAFRSARVDDAAVRGASGERVVHFERGQPGVATRLIARGDVTAEPQQGPAIIESYDTTIVVPPGARFHADRIGNIIIDIAS
jgi:N-methylhydantoinase A